MEIKTSVTKNTDIERYDIRVGYDWTTIAISSNGLFMAEGSYGNYAYWWSNHGRESFKHFLVELDRDHGYAKGKFGRQDTFYQDKTVKEIKSQLLEARRKGDLTKEDARDAYDFTCSTLDDINSLDLFVNSIYEHHVLSNFYQDYDSIPIHRGFDQQLEAFMTTIFTVFVAEIKKEIYGEQNEKSDT